ncbi:MAG: hypothetical protein GXY03_00385 [Solirubrobacterales bacterium]|nr:hypothetical protein [Solirubrobacterales bacterium]
MNGARRRILGPAAVVCAAVAVGAAGPAVAVAPGVATSAVERAATADTAPAAGDARTAACGGAQRFAPGRRAVPGRAPLAVGDSVLLGAARAVAARGFEVDVRGCRQTSEGLALLRARAAAGTLPRFVVIALGTNGPVTRADLAAALRIVGRDRLLGLVTPRELGGGSGADAETIRAVARRRPGRTLLLDWVAAAAGRGGLTYGDGIHLAPAGQTAMADLFADGLDRAYPLTAKVRRVRVRPFR